VYEKLVVVTQKTRLEGLVERFNTRDQAKFYLEHMGLSFADYDREHETYARAVQSLRRQLDGLLPKMQLVERSFLPTFLFAPKDLVLTVGRDGLVVNTAKYLDGQQVVAVNPDPGRNDGVLLPFLPAQARAAVTRVLDGKARCHEITMAEVRLNDGQHLLAFHDFFAGQRTHLSARYGLSWRGRSEEQSSSGVLVTTGAGSTGWFSSVQNMAASVSGLLLGEKAPELPRLRMRWGDRRLAWVVREPFLSRASGVKLGAGLLEEGEELLLESHMPEGGVIFSDGVEADALAFNAGAVASVRTSERRTRLVAR